MKTAEEILINNGVLKELGIKNNFNLQLTRDCYTGTQRNIKKAMIEFAKMHVQNALKTASEKAKTKTHEILSDYVDKDSILKSYSLENIV